MILVGCFTHGVQRYDLKGRNEGAYHLGGSAALAVPDFAGRTFAVDRSGQSHELLQGVQIGPTALIVGNGVGNAGEQG